MIGAFPRRSRGYARGYLGLVMNLDAYNALRDECAVIELEGRGLISVKGDDRARFLHAMTTAGIQGLAEGAGILALFLSDKGRILAEALVLSRDEDLFVDTEPGTRELLLEHLDRFIIMDDVELEDDSAAYCVFGVEGPRAATLLEGLGARLPEQDHAYTVWGEAIVAKYSYSGGPGYRIYAPAAAKDEWLAKLSAAGAVICDLSTADAVRLEYGRPRHGVDFSDQNLVHEAQLMSRVTPNKGCYIGQEIIERVRSRGNVNKLLVRVVAETAEAPLPNTPVMVDEKEAGAVKSAAFSPALGKSLVFAMIRAEFVKPDAGFRVNEAEGSLAGAGRLG